MDELMTYEWNLDIKKKSGTQVWKWHWSNLDEINEIDGTFNMDDKLYHMWMKLVHESGTYGWNSNNMDENDELVSFVLSSLLQCVILVMLPIFIHRWLSFMRFNFMHVNLFPSIWLHSIYVKEVIPSNTTSFLLYVASTLANLIHMVKISCWHGY
jgi:hypothetical protein